MIQIEGQTEDGRKVVSGLFRFYETHGIPLVMLFTALEGMNVVPDWGPFYHEARRAGVKAERILAMLHSDISDVYGREYRDAVLQRLEMYHELVQEAVRP